MNISIKSMVLGLVGTNCYLITNDETKETVIVDPADQGEQINQRLIEQGMKPVAVLLTHGHFDHIMGVDAVRDRWQIPVYLSADEKDLIADPALNGCSMIGRNVSVKADHFVSDGQSLVLGAMLFEVISTSGHTAGSVCYYMPQSDVLLSGDTLFEGSVGRTDLPTGSMSRLVRSIREKLMTLKDEVQVLPGHGGATTMGYEKQYNPYF